METVFDRMKPGPPQVRAVLSACRHLREDHGVTEIDYQGSNYIRLHFKAHGLPEDSKLSYRDNPWGIITAIHALAGL